MKQMGYQPEKESRKNNATKLWKENERSVFGEICRNMGLEVEAERKARGSLSVEEYKEVRDQMIGEIEQEKEAIVAEVEPLRELKTGIDEIDTTGTKLPFGVVAIKKKDLEAVKEQAKAYTANRDEIGEMRERVPLLFLGESSERISESSSTTRQMSWQGNSNSFSRCTKDSSILISSGEVRARRQGERQEDSRPANREYLSKGSNLLPDGSNGPNQGRTMG